MGPVCRPTAFPSHSRWGRSGCGVWFTLNAAPSKRPSALRWRRDPACRALDGYSTCSATPSMKSATRRSRTAAALTAVALLPLVACSGGSTTTDELSYQIVQPLKAVVIAARGASVAILVGDGPVTVTEEHRYSG